MVTVTTMQPSVGFVMPDAAQLKSLRKIVAAACSWIGGISEQSAEADLEFRNAIWGVGRFWRTELPDERRSFGSLLDDANEMLIAKGYASVGGPMFLAACLAAGDVVYRRGDPSVGQLLSIGLNSFQGMRANNRLRRVGTSPIAWIKAKQQKPTRRQRASMVETINTNPRPDCKRLGIRRVFRLSRAPMSVGVEFGFAPGSTSADAITNPGRPVLRSGCDARRFRLALRCASGRQGSRRSSPPLPDSRPCRPLFEARDRASLEGDNAAAHPTTVRNLRARSR